MISVVVAASDDAAALARLLTQLVPAAAEGLVRDVLVRGARGLSCDVVLDCGATALGDGDDLIRLARGDWVAGLPLGARLASGWMETVERQLAAEPPAAARLVSRGRWPLAQGSVGWLVPRVLVLGARAVEQDLERLARRSRRVLRVFDR